ncbi:alpha/beta hydrolase [Marinimicrobium agarilyticum]|uniref:alpha/beta hydrolase n=1 Tax=Marinimicrobium agarilyticum TaxID=306546 RepID=UPI000421972C|nr:alpha/beta hydrolase [Marinimicrobium agarilyticum]
MTDEVVARIGSLEFRDCALATPYHQRYVQCAFVEVPENYDEPEERRLELLVIRLPASAARTTDDPVLAIAGGPGQAASDSFLWLDRAFQDLARQRDIYLIDQRGTGHSNAQTCDLSHREDLLLADDRESFRELGRECLAQFKGDPRQYTTPVAVRDFERVREALGVAQWNLYGVSYGTRVAQSYMRTYPTAVRTAVLDGVLPAQENFGPQIALHSQAALDALVVQCQADEACREAYPDLGSGLEALFERLDTAPVEFHYREISSGDQVQETLRRAHLVSIVRMALYNSEVLSVLPPMLAQAYREDDFAALARMSRRLDISDQLAMGMHNSVMCSEDVPFIENVPTDALKNTYMGTQMVEALKGLCEVWPRGDIDASYKQPLRSAIPTLLLSGERDPVTPPAYGEALLEGLERARHITVPHRGHHVGITGCMPRVIAQFVESAQTEGLQVECLGRLETVPLFLNVNGPSP